MAILLVFIAAIFGTISNFCMRRSVDFGGSAKAYLVFQLFFSFVAVFLLTNVPNKDYHFSMQASGIGIPGGILLGTMMWAIGRCIEKGPAGLTFAAHNSASVMPGIIMWIFFGISCGHMYTFWNGFGSTLVVFGLFWAGNTAEKNDKKSSWLMFVTLAFVLNVVYICFMQWRALLLNPLYLKSKFVPFCIEGIPSQWFMPMIFLSATVIQLIIFLFSQQSWPNFKVILWSLFGGAANGSNLFFVIKATEKASTLENAMIFPISSVATIVMCNLWAQFIYQENVNWRANAVCVFGLIVGTINWNALF